MAKKPSTRKTKPTKTKIAVQLLLWVGLPTGMLGLSALLLNQWRTDTHIKLELTAKSMQLLIRPYEVLSGIFYWLVLEKAFYPVRRLC